jgi:endothelin-converting enzyme/putative endopeptidase
MEAYAQEHPDRVVRGTRFTPEQQFFLGYAQSWCTNERPEIQRVLARTDPHAPPRYRVNGPLSNLPQFQKAFQCKATDRMVAQNRCTVW